MELNCQLPLFLFRRHPDSSACLQLTWYRAAKDLQPHAQGAVPALGDYSNVSSQHGLGQLVHHWSVLITVGKEKLDKTEKGDLDIRDTRTHGISEVDVI